MMELLAIEKLLYFQFQFRLFSVFKFINICSFCCGMLDPVYLLISQDQTNDLNCTLSITIKDSSILYSDAVYFGSCPVIIRLFIQREHVPEDLSMKLYKCQNSGSYKISACTSTKNSSDYLHSYWPMQYNVENMYACKISLDEPFRSTSAIQLHSTKYSIDNSSYYLVVTLPIIYTAMLVMSLIILISKRIRSLTSFKKTQKVPKELEEEISVSYKRMDRVFHQLRMHTSKFVEVDTSDDVTLLADHLLINYEVWPCSSPTSATSDISPDSESNIYNNNNADVDFLCVEASDDVNAAESADSIMLESLMETALRLVDTELIYIIDDEDTGIAMDKYSADEHPFPFEDDIAEIDNHLTESAFTVKASSLQHPESTHAAPVYSNSLINSLCDPVVPMLDVKLTAGTKKMTVDMKERAKVFEPALRRSFDGNYTQS